MQAEIKGDEKQLFDLEWPNNNIISSSSILQGCAICYSYRMGSYTILALRLVVCQPLMSRIKFRLDY